MSNYGSGYPPPPPEGGGYPPSGYQPPEEGGYRSPDYGYPAQNVQDSFVSRPIHYPDQTSQPLLPQETTVAFNVAPETRHYGRAPMRQPRRYKTVKRVKLFEGNFVIDCPVPERLLQHVPRKGDREFTHMRYTACTCKPDEFKDSKYTLRQQLLDPPRQTELFIVLTMYN
ncbi:1578_t:CDS:1, partial [Acaulospora morrowiae]